MNEELPPYVENDIKPAFDEIRNNMEVMKTTGDYVSIDDILRSILDSPGEREEEWKLFCIQWRDTFQLVERSAAQLRRIYTNFSVYVSDILDCLLDDETKASLFMIQNRMQYLNKNDETAVFFYFKLIPYLDKKIRDICKNEEWGKRIYDKYAHKLADAKLPCASSDVIQKMIEKVVSFITAQ